MRRNSGIVGPTQKPKNTLATGVFDMYDVRSWESVDKWPPTKKVTNVQVSDYSPDEGDDLIFTISTSGYFDGDWLYYSVETVSGSMTTADFVDGTLTGSFQINSDVGTFSKLLTKDPTGTPDENDVFNVHIRSGSVSGDILMTTNDITITDQVVSSQWRSMTTSTSVNGAYNPNPVNIYYRRSCIKVTYASSFMIGGGGGGSGTIEKIRIYITNPLSSTYTPLPNYGVYMKNSSSSVSSNPGNSGWSTVWGRGNYYPTSSGWSEFNISDFTWTGGTLCICFAWGQCPNGYTADGQSYTFSGSGSTGYMWYSRSDGSGYYTASSSANSSYNNYVPRIDMYF